MPILSRLYIPYSGASKRAIDLPKCKHSNGRFIVLLGENGTRKSLMLRHLLDNCYYKNPIGAEVTDPGNVFYSRPEQVIAISATPTDRFPSKSAPTERMSRYDSKDYYYLGPRTGRNLISRNHSVFELVLAILRNPSRLAMKSSFIKNLMLKCQLPSRMNFEFDFTARFNIYWRNSSDDVTVDGFAKYANKYAADRVEKFSVDSDALRSLFLKIGRSAERSSYQSLLSFRYVLYVDFSNGSIDSSDIEMGELLEGLLAGVLKVRKIGFNNDVPDVHSASSGQWNLFSSLVSLSLVVKDNALILIDEPENTLHPLWQSEYLGDVLSGIAGSKGCEVVVATHSPLLASSTKDGRDIIVKLFQFNDEVSYEIMDTPEGWSANDVLENTFDLRSNRSFAIVQVIEKALSLIAGGIKKNQRDLNRLHAKLKRYQLILPDDDPLVNVISSILQSTSN